MKNKAINDFLLGTADDQQQRECEELLANPETIVQYESTVSDDSLLLALKIQNESTTDQLEIDRLAARMEKLVSRHAITAVELERVLDAAEQPEDLGKIGRYRVVEFLASGAMGLVFRAIDSDLDREVCIKLLSPTHEFDVEAKSRFERESREAARMNCERIVTVLDVGTQRGLPYFVMPLLSGMSMRTFLDRGQKVQPERAIAIARQIAEGLEYAHGRNILHRDIKPDNLWLIPNGDIKLLDFGLARIEDETTPITRSGTVVGTPSYMSPEQVIGKTIDERSDLFSVGVVLVELLTGESPFKRANLFSTLMSVAGEEIDIDELDPKREIPLGLRDVVQRLLKKNPLDRVGSAAELIECLDQVQAAPQAKLTTQVDGGKKRWIWSIATALAGFLICLGAIGIWKATDKGTLVVSANDSAVEVKIANERVMVRDPLTDRQYEIRIGDTPLPSGVYQLEMTTGKGELVFSSQTIAIKRGQKTIVTVALVSDATSVAAEGSTKNMAAEPARDHAAKSSGWADPTRDERAYDPKSRATYAAAISSVPSISLYESGFKKGSPISEHASVQNPKLFEGIDSWSIESISRPLKTLQPNVDNSKFAGMSNGYVRIYNREGKITSLLPIPGIPQRMTWDTASPDLIAVSSFVGQPSKPLEENPKNPYSIFVWHVDENNARLISNLHGCSRSFAWDNGYRIVHFANDQLKINRVDTESSWSIPDSSTETLHDNSVSPDGRFVATYDVAADRSQISIWDLRKGKLAIAIPDGIDFKWHDNSRNIVVTVSPHSYPPVYSVEMWSLETNSLTRSFTPEGSDAITVSPVVNHELSTMAAVLKSREILLTDLRTGRRTTIDPASRVADWARVDGRQRKPPITLEWTRDGNLRIQSGHESLIWVRRDSSLGGEFKEQTTVGNIAGIESEADLFETTYVSMAENGNIVIVGTSDQTRSDESGLRSYEAIVLSSDGRLERTKFKSSDWRQRNTYPNQINAKLRPRVSPSGEFVLAWGKSSGNRFYGLSAARNLRVVDLRNPEKLLSIGNFESLRCVAWSSNSKYLTVVGRETYSRGNRDATKVIDLAKWEEHEVNGLTNQSATCAAWKNGFLCITAKVVQKRPTKYRRQLSYLDLESEMVLKQIGSEYEPAQFDFVTGSVARFWGKPWTPDSEQPEETQLFRILDDLKIEPVDLVSTNNYTSRLSKDAIFQFRQMTDNPRKRSFTDNYSISEVESQESRISWQGHTLDFRWHHKVPFFACWVNRAALFFGDPAKGTTRLLTLTGENYQIQSLGTGWMVRQSDFISMLDFDGRPVSRISLVFDENGEPAFARAIFSDGSAFPITDKDVYIVFAKDDIFRLSRLDEFKDKNSDFKLPVATRRSVFETDQE